jgi:hypothetical protein
VSLLVLVAICLVEHQVLFCGLKQPDSLVASEALFYLHGNDLQAVVKQTKQLLGRSHRRSLGVNDLSDWFESTAGWSGGVGGWFSRDGVLAAYPGDGLKPDLLLVVDLGAWGRARGRAFAGELRNGDSTRWYRGRALHRHVSGGWDLTYGFLDNLLVVSSAPGEAERAVDLSLGGRGGILGSARHGDLVNGALTHDGLWGYLDLKAVVAQAEQRLLSNPLTAMAVAPVLESLGARNLDHLSFHGGITPRSSDLTLDLVTRGPTLVEDLFRGSGAFTNLPQSALSRFPAYAAASLRPPGDGPGTAEGGLGSALSSLGLVLPMPSAVAGEGGIPALLAATNGDLALVLDASVRPRPRGREVTDHLALVAGARDPSAAALRLVALLQGAGYSLDPVETPSYLGCRMERYRGLGGVAPLYLGRAPGGVGLARTDTALRAGLDLLLDAPVGARPVGEPRSLVAAIDLRRLGERDPVEPGRKPDRDVDSVALSLRANPRHLTLTSHMEGSFATDGGLAGGVRTGILAFRYLLVALAFLAVALALLESRSTPGTAWRHPSRETGVRRVTRGAAAVLLIALTGLLALVQLLGGRGPG